MTTTLTTPAGAPPSLSPGGRRTARALTVIVAAVLVAGVVGTLAMTAWGLSTFRVTTDSRPLPAAMRTLVVDTADIPMAVRLTVDREATAPQAALRLISSAGSGEHALTVSADGADARVGIAGQPASPLGLPAWARGGELTVTLPPDQARRLTVTADSDNGVLLAQADLDTLIARTGNGAVVLSGAARAVEVTTDNGQIVSRRPIAVSESFTATIGNGDIAVDFADAAPRTVDVSSRNGDINLGLPSAGPYLVHSQSGGSSRVRVAQTASADQAAAVIDVRSDNGDVTVSGPRPGMR